MINIISIFEDAPAGSVTVVLFTPPPVCALMGFGPVRMLFAKVPPAPP